MPRKSKERCCEVDTFAGFKVEAVVNVDDRGQMVLPKDIREKAGIMPGDKLAVVTSIRDGKVCCIHLFRAEQLMDSVRAAIGPLAEEIGK